MRCKCRREAKALLGIVTEEEDRVLAKNRQICRRSCNYANQSVGRKRVGRKSSQSQPPGEKNTTGNRYQKDCDKVKIVGNGNPLPPALVEIRYASVSIGQNHCHVEAANDEKQLHGMASPWSHPREEVSCMGIHNTQCEIEPQESHGFSKTSQQVALSRKITDGPRLHTKS